MSAATLVRGFIGATVLALSSAVVFAQESSCPPNSHPVGDNCQCDPGYFSPKGSGQCVPDAEACRAYGAAHREGENCVCDDGYAMFAGDERCIDAHARCAQIGAVFKKGKGCVCRPGEAQFGNDPRCVSVAEHCGRFNAVFDAASGDCQCRAGESWHKEEKRCISLRAFCARYDAVWNAAKGECECPPGKVENERLQKCVPAPQESEHASPPRPGSPPTAPPEPHRRSTPERGEEPHAMNRPETARAAPEPVLSPSTGAESDRSAPVWAPPGGEESSRAPSVSAPPGRAEPSVPRAAFPSSARPATAPPSRGATPGDRPARASGPPTPARLVSRSEPSESVITEDFLASFDATELSEEDRELGRRTLLEAAGEESRAQQALTEKQLESADAFINADLRYSDGGGEVQIAPAVDAMMESRRRARVEIEHRKEMAAHRRKVREAREAERLRPGVDRAEYEALQRRIEHTRQKLEWAEKEHAHQNVRLYEALHADEDDLKKANFKSLGREHAERFKVPVTREKQYDGLDPVTLQALASRDCFRNIEGAYEQILAARKQLKREEAELESLLDVPEKPSMEDTDRRVINWYQ